MLKINTRDDGRTLDFDLEGKLAGPWVDELARCWEKAGIGKDRIRVVLNAVTFIDAAGKKLLTEMHGRGVELVARGCMIKAIIDEIEQGKKRKRDGLGPP